jgi:hypothetical protein
MDGEGEIPNPMADNDESYFLNASLCIFHVDSSFRRICLELSEPFEAYEKFVKVRTRHLRERTMQRYDCFIPAEDKPVKKRLIGLNAAFDGIILILIIFSSLMLPIDSPLNDPEGVLA